MKTRNLLLLAFTFIFSNNICTAQFHLGAKAGANMTKLDGQAFDDRFELGYQLGGFVSYDVTELIGLQAEVLFNQTNTTIADSYSDVFNDAFDSDKTLNYISVPILLRLNLGGLLAINAGPQFSFLADDDDSVLENGKKIFNNTDFAAVAGAELDLNPVIIYARYAWGFSDISDIGGDANSHQIQVGVGLRLF